MYADAIKTYSDIVKNKNYAAANRLRVNMGNIYFKQNKFPNAIKMYRMALDTIKPGLGGGQQVRAKIMRNIGISFLRIGQCVPHALSHCFFVASCSFSLTAVS